MLAIVLAGFQPFYFKGEGMGGRIISAQLFPLVLERHRAMMLLASLRLIAGATVRMPFLFPIFGEGGWTGVFGPLFTLGALFLLTRSLLTGAFDRWLAAGYATLIVFCVAATTFAVTDAWSYLARALFNT